MEYYGMFDEDLEPIKRKVEFTPRILDDMSIDEIKEYISEIKSEITRCEEDIKKKKSHMDAASSFFK